jgi:tetratricopeptide (TPR) repeat protein
MTPASPANPRLLAAVCLALALGTLALYWPITKHPFINYDDYGYIVENPHVNTGLSWTNVVWAFEHKYAANWHPLTWISHMLDCQMFGLHPAGHHFVNALFHGANAVLLFLLLTRTTGALWRSAFVAAFFAWHPLRVESVAWAAERKDVLSAFFWMLTLMAYAKYVTGDRCQVTGTNSGSIVSRVSYHMSPFYWLALFFFACGLMSKPMVVTLPFVLLLLDFWPLQRFTPKASGVHAATLQRLLAEKIPFFVLGFAVSAVTFWVQGSSGAFWSLENLPAGARLANAVAAYLGYISKTFYPTDLAIIYSHPQHWPAIWVAVAALLLLVWTSLIVWRATEHPYLVTGWLWFLGTLVPVIGLVQVGVQSMADRYTYLPGIGLLIAVVWGANEWFHRPRQKVWLATVGSLALAGCVAGTARQLSYWQSELTLFGHAVEVTTDNYAAEVCLGEALERTGHPKEAFDCYADAVRLEPDYPIGQFKLGMMFIAEHKPADALAHLNIAAGLMPHNADLQYDLGVFFEQQGQPRDAADHFRAALAERPDFPEAKRELSSLVAAHPEVR